MIERGCGVQGGQSKQAVGQHLVHLLRGMKHVRIEATPEFSLANP